MQNMIFQYFRFITLIFLVYCTSLWAQIVPSNNSRSSYATTLNVKTAPYSCVGDGVADDTTCLQAALNVFSGLNATGSIFLPTGSYKITSTLTYTGKSSTSVGIEGPLSIGRGIQGAVLQWYGSTGGTMIHFKGANNSYIKNLGIYGRTTALIGFLAAFDTVGGVGSSRIRLENVVMGGFEGTGSRHISLGADGTNTQVSEVSMDKLTLVGSGTGTSYYGIATGTANAKNFSLTDSVISGFRYGVVFGYDSTTSGFVGGSGYFSTRGNYYSYNSVSDIHAGPGFLNVSGGGSEGSGALLLGTTGGNLGSATIQNFYWNGITDSTDYMIAYSGALFLTGNNFYNGRTSTSEPKVKYAAALSDTGTGGVITSIGNRYAQVVGTYPPLYNGSDIALSTLDASLYNVRSYGDVRSDGGGGNWRFLNELPDKIKPKDVTFATLSTIVGNGQIRHCTDCLHGSNPCTGGSTGAIVKKLNGICVCD